MDLLTLAKVIEKEQTNVESLRNLGIKLNNNEFQNINEVVRKLSNLDCFDFKDFIKNSNNFYFGYDIPQIGKEFDLIRLGTNFNLNIEIKSDSTKQKQIEQIKRNYYYLKFLTVEPKILSIDINNNNILLGEVKNQQLTIEKTTLDRLYYLICNQNLLLNNNIDNSFNPKNYLISPFNDTEKFMNDEYFLTQHQNEIKLSVLKNKYNAIEGNPGTGKSLLLYDVVKTLTKDDSIISNEIYVIQSGKLNSGHEILLQNLKINIIPARNVNQLDFSSIKYIFIDEAQRLYSSQMETIMKKSLEHQINLNFFFDANQTFEKKNNGERNKLKIKNFIEENEGNSFTLKDKIRSNKKLSDFIRQTISFRPNQITKVDNMNKNIEIIYCDSLEEMVLYKNIYTDRGFKTIGYTPSMYYEDHFHKYHSAYLSKPHDVIGQEFDNVFTIIDEGFVYKKNDKTGKMELTNNTNQYMYYSARKMFFQNITRVRDKLVIVVINNIDIYNTLISFLDCM